MFSDVCCPENVTLILSLSIHETRCDFLELRQLHILIYFIFYSAGHVLAMRMQNVVFMIVFSELVTDDDYPIVEPILKPLLFGKKYFLSSVKTVIFST